MIISHRHKFIFIKTKKVGGTSLEVALSKFCGKKDIITPNGSDDYRKELGFMTARNYKKKLIKLNLRDVFVAIDRKSRPLDFYNHIPATEIRQKIGQDTWCEYFKFTIVRNPFDRMVSSYFWYIRAKDDPISFAQFLRASPSRVAENWRIYSDNGKVVLNDFVRYENLEADLERISRQIGLCENIYDIMKDLGAKKGIRPNNSEYRTIIGKQEKTLIGILDREEIEEFGYEY